MIAYSCGAVYLFGYLRSGRSPIRLAVRATALQGDLLRDILKVGALACISPLQTVLTILILTRLVARFGTNALAGYGIGTRLEFLLVPIAGRTRHGRLRRGLGGGGAPRRLGRRALIKRWSVWRGAPATRPIRRAGRAAGSAPR